MRTALLVLALALVPASVHADAIGPCPPGQRVVMNPTSPGAMHHGGFHCEPETPPEAPPPTPPTTAPVAVEAPAAVEAVAPAAVEPTAEAPSAPSAAPAPAPAPAAASDSGASCAIHAGRGTHRVAWALSALLLTLVARRRRSR